VGGEGEREGNIKRGESFEKRRKLNQKRKGGEARLDNLPSGQSRIDAIGERGKKRDRQIAGSG